MGYDDALRGYAFYVLQRDGFKCRYCGFDGKESFANWVLLSRDHLLPVGHSNRDDDRYIVAACRFCNEAHNRTKFDVQGKTPDEIVEIKREAILERRGEYEEFWREKVRGWGSDMVAHPDSFDGRVERAIRQSIRQGQTLYTPSRHAPFTVGKIDSHGVVLLLGKGQWATRLSWECLEGVVPFLKRYGGVVDIGGQHQTVGRPGTLDGYFKDCISRTVAGWMAVILETAGLVDIIHERPARVRLLQVATP